VRFVTGLPNTRSGKRLRRAIQALCESRDPGDPATLDDPAALARIRDALPQAGILHDTDSTLQGASR
jgi:propionyl-CoA synthetase